jgi:threonine aldolase
MRQAMVEAMSVAPGFGPREDPIVSRLERLAADRLGKDDALFCPTCTMANQIAIHVRCGRGQTFLAEPTAHAVIFEQSAFAQLSGVMPKLVPSTDFAPDPEAVVRALRPLRPLDHRVSLIWTENTHVHSGGRVVGLETLRGIRRIADEFAVPVHLDGARLFNAAMAFGVSVKILAALADTVSISLNKGLGAPLGAILAGPRDFVADAVRVRQMFGGGWRPATIPAAAGIVALETMVDRLIDDHRRAKRLAEAIRALPGIEVDPRSVESNIVLARVALCGLTAVELADALAKEQILIGAYEPNFIRLVTHADIDDDAVAHALEVFPQVMRKSRSHA